MLGDEGGAWIWSTHEASGAASVSPEVSPFEKLFFLHEIVQGAAVGAGNRRGVPKSWGRLSCCDFQHRTQASDDFAPNGLKAAVDGVTHAVAEGRSLEKVTFLPQLKGSQVGLTQEESTRTRCFGS